MEADELNLWAAYFGAGRGSVGGGMTINDLMAKLRAGGARQVQ